MKPEKTNPMRQIQPPPDDVNALIALYNGGHFAELESRARQLVVRHPDFGFGWKLLGGALQMQGKNALPAFQKTAELLPDNADAHYNLGIAQKELGLLDEAAASYRRALKIKPDYAEAHSNLGNVLKDLGQLDEAVASYRRALKIKPDSAEAHNNLGIALKGLGQLDEAVASYRRAVALQPKFALAYYNLGNALKELGKLDEAATSFRRSVEIKPDFADAHNNLGATLKELSQFDAALDSYRQALELKPGFAEAHNNLGVALLDLGQLNAAVSNCRRALELKPDFVDAHNNLGNALQELGELDGAVISYRHALKIKPGNAKAHYNLGNALKNLDRLEEAVSCYRRALEIKPDYAEAHNSLGNALQNLGQLDAALASYQRAVEIKPDFAIAKNNLLFLYCYHALINPDDYLAQARAWEQTCVPEQDRQAAQHRVFQRSPLAGRRLRVGYVSGDYNQHAVSFFIEQLFARHDRARIELFAYYIQSKRDAVTARLQALSEHWVPLAGMHVAAIRDRIEADGIDVLVDLSGHTNHNRMGVFARRAAPVQAHYLGFMASTGLTEMDYWIGDGILTPAETDSHFSEQVWRLPRVWVCYDGKADAPVPAWQPSRDGIIWLGSFNNLGKLTPETLALWAQVLHALPEGKLLLKTRELSDSGNRQRILDAMSGHGILSERIELQDRGATPDWSAHMAYYDRLDIALDPVGGHGGGTTSCDALWMGVPAITLEGNRMGSRMTASMLNAIGRPECIARSEAEYIGKVLALARDVEGRKSLRPAQRALMAASPLCDARGLAMSLENAYFEMFERWLDKKFR